MFSMPLIQVKKHSPVINSGEKHSVRTVISSRVHNWLEYCIVLCCQVILGSKIFFLTLKFTEDGFCIEAETSGLKIFRC